jgi:hypothetical protein
MHYALYALYEMVCSCWIGVLVPSCKAVGCSYASPLQQAVQYLVHSLLVSPAALVPPYPVVWTASQ